MNALTLGRRGRRRAARLIAPLVVLLAVTGCLDKPKITDRWTRIDLLAANVSPGQLIQPGARESLSVSTNIIYRSILTGFAVADLRVSGTLGPGSVNVSPDAQSTPNSATMSPADASAMSFISFECMRTRRGTFTFFCPAEQLTMKSPLETLPW